MGVDFIKEHLSSLLFHQISHTRNEEGIFGELTDENEDRVRTLTLGDSPIKSMVMTLNGCIGLYSIVALQGQPARAKVAECFRLYLQLYLVRAHIYLPRQIGHTGETALLQVALTGL